MRWKEIPVELGTELWKSYRNDLLRRDRVVSVHAVSHGDDFVETVISVTQGDAVLLRLVTSFDLDWETAPDGISFTGERRRINEVTRYYLPIVKENEA